MPLLLLPFIPFVIAGCRPTLPNRWARATASLFTTIIASVFMLGAALDGVSFCGCLGSDPRSAAATAILWLVPAVWLAVQVMLFRAPRRRLATA